MTSAFVYTRDHFSFPTKFQQRLGEARDGERACNCLGELLVLFYLYFVFF